MVVLFGCCLQVNAQSDLTVADGTSTSSYLPLYGLNADTQGMKGQCLYPADSLTDMAGGSISQITFYCGSTVPAEVWGGTFIVYLGETDESNLSSAFISTDDLTAVYTGTLDATSGTLTIEFDDAYTYQGGNLVVDVTLSVTGNWKSASFLGVNNLTGSGRYRTSGSGAGSATAFLPKVTFEYTPGGSVGPTCDKPESVEANDVTANSATINWIGSASAYNLQYKASSDEDWTLVKNLTGNSYALTGLVSNTAYQAQVQAICGENTSGWKSVSFNTLIGIPYAEHFNGTSKPNGWNIYTGTLNADGSAELTASTSYWTFGTKSGVFDNHAHIEVYSTRNAWLVTPSIPIPEMEEGDPGYHMLFNLALTYWTGDNVPAPAAQAGAHLYVLASMDGGNNWATLREWNNTGSPYVFDDITCSAEGQEVDLILSDYAGQTIQLAFYLSTSGSGDNRIHIDDLMIEKIPTCLKPTGLHAVDGAATSTTLPVAWTANSGETAWRLQYKPVADAEAEWITLDIAANPYTITGLNAFTEYEIRVAAVCTEEDFTDYGKSIIAKTAAVVPFAQTFDTTAMPGEWKRYEALAEAVGEGTAELVAINDGWKVGTQNGVFGNEHLYLNIAGTSTKYWLVSPVIEMAEGYQLTFDLALTTKAGTNPTAVTAGEQNDDQFIVFITTDGGANWTALGTWGNGGQGSSFDQINTEGQTIKLDLSAYATNSIMLAFYGESTGDPTDDNYKGDNNLHISNVAIAPIPACERPLSITLGTIGGTTAQISWDADEDGTWEYGYKANPADDFVPAETDYTGSTSDKFVDLEGLAETTDYLFFVRRACGETEKSEPLTKAFKTIQTPASLPYDWDFEEGNGWLLVNGDLTNKWAYGIATSKSPSHALYISNDNGLSHAYTYGSQAMVYATKTFYFGETGMYSFSFDWKGEADSYNYDYMRVALAPMSVDPVAATSTPTGFSRTALPAGWIALDGGTGLDGAADWQNQLAEINIESVGNYKVIIAWRNNTSYDCETPGAIDNFKISRIACTRPNGLQVSHITYTGASFDWEDDADGMKWVYACVPATEDEPADEAFVPVEQNSITLSDLDYNTAYVFYLRKNCVADGMSDSRTIEFKTLNPFEITVADGTSTSSYVPIYGTWTDAYIRSQFIIPASQLADIQWDSITNLTFYASAAEIAWGNAQFEVYLAEVANDTLQELKDYDAMIKVVNAKALAISDYMMEVALDAPFQYTGGNLMVGFKQTVTGTYKGASWLGTARTNASMGGYLSTSGSLSVSSYSFQPKTTIGFKKGVAPACSTPKAFHAIDTLITETTATLAWKPISPETNWVIRYKVQGAEDWAAVVPVATDTFKVLAGLNPATIYEAQIATQCDPEDAENIGDYSSSILFATSCVPFATVNEGFEGTPLCWNAIRAGNYPAILSNYPEDAYSGTKFLYFYSNASDEPADEYVILPELISLDNMRIKFMARNDYELSEDIEGARVVVGVMPDQVDTANFVALQTFTLTSNVYTQYVVPFTEYTGDYKYVAIKMLAASQLAASLLIDDVIVEEIPACLEPTGLVAVADSLTSTSAVLAWTAQGDEANWLVRYRKVSEEEVEWSEPIQTTNDTLLISGLEPATAYEAQVAAWCDPTNEEAMSPYTEPLTFSTMYGIPFVEAFGTAKPADWSLYTGWLDSITSGVADLTAATSGWNFGTGNGVFDEHARTNIYGTTWNKWLLTPAIEMQAGVQLTFDLALTTYSGTPGTIDKTQQADDRFFVLFSIDHGATWDSLRVWNNTGSEYVYNDIATAGQDVKIVLDDSLANKNVIFAFYGESHIAGGDNNLHIDNVKIAAIPSCERPMGLAATTIAATSVTLDWAPQSAEEAWMLQYKKSADEEWTALEEAVTVRPYTLEGLEPATAYDVKIAAKCSDEDMSEYSKAFSFTTECMIISTFPYKEGFDSITGATASHVLPICWNYINTSTYSSYKYYPTVYASASAANTPNNSLRFYSQYSSYTDYDPQDQYAILPQMEGVNGLRIKFNARKYSASYDATVYVGVMTDPADTSTFVQIASLAPTTAEYEPFVVPLSSYAGEGQYIAFKMPKSTYSYRGLYIDDIVVEEIPNCLEPTGLEISEITEDGAKATWNNEENGAWKYAYALASAEMPAEFIAITDTFVVMSELLENKDYVFYLVKDCGNDAYSEVVAQPFHTKMGPAAVPYADDFEDGNNWMFINGSYTNAWVLGEAAHNGEGTHALYISNNGGTSHAYTTSSPTAVYAVKVFDLEAGTYTFQYDWLANGESNYDLLCVALVPDTLELTVSTSGTFSLPTGWTKLYAATKLNLSTTWKTETFDVTVDKAGLYKVVLLWRDDTSGGSQTPAAVDNFSITKITCLPVSELTVTNITSSSATIGWTNGEESQEAWQLVYTADPEFDLAEVTDEEIIDVASNPYALAELITDTLYTVYVRANCGDEDGVSVWATTTFRTASACQQPDDVKVDTLTTTSATISWNAYGQTGFNLRYSTDGENWTVVEDIETSPYVIEGLDAGTRYGVQVQNSCNTAAWTSPVTFKTVYGVPYAENFNALTDYPTEWLRYSGVLIDDVLAGTAKLTTPASLGWTFRSETDKVFNSKHISVNIWSTIKYWTVLPNVALDENVQLSFTMALTKSTTAYTQIATTGTDDKFVVLISTDNGATWTILRQWDNAGSEYVYNNIALYGEEVTIDLSQYANQNVQIALYGASTVSNADNYLHVDDVLIDHIPACVKPTGLTVSDVFARSAKLSWTAGAAEQGAWDIALDTIANFNPDTLTSILTVNENPYTLTNLLPSHTYYVYVRANCGEEDGNSVWTARQSFTTTISCPAPNGLEAELTMGNGSIATLTWIAAEATEWTVQYGLDNTFEETNEQTVTEASIDLTGLTAEATYYARVKANCDEETSSAWSTVISFVPTDIYSMVVNDGTTTNSYVPIYGTYVDEGNTASQFIVPAAEIQELLWDSITALTFHSSTASINWGAAEFEVYVAPTEAATLDALVEWSKLTQVMTAANLTVVDNKMVVTFSEPFQYTGDNLLIGFKQTVAGDWKSTSWYGNTLSGASIGGYGTGNNMAQRNFLPKMTVNYVPGEAPACMWATHIEVSEITAAGATFAWDAVEDANWEYAVVPADEDLIPTEFAEATNPLVLDNLEEATSYIFYLRNNCGEENSKLVSVAFSTVENIAALPYETTFADAQGWKLFNDANAWVIADNELFISNNGETYGYDEDAASVSFATKLFDFVKDTIYTVSYEWKCEGEYNDEDGALDFMRVALVPAEVELTAGVAPEGLTADNLPQGWIALDTLPLYGQASYATMELDVEVPVGHYRVAFIWINDDSSSDGAPAAINSFEIGFQKTPTRIDGGAGIESKAVKFLKNNHVYIRINDRIYDATGRRVE